MDYIIRPAKISDKNFILNSHNEVNDVSNLDYSCFAKNIDNDLFRQDLCKSLIMETNGNQIGYLLYSYVYWADYGRGIYLSNAYISKDYRGKGLFKSFLNELEKLEPTCKFITNMVGNENEAMIKVMDKLNFKSFNLLNYYKTINTLKTKNN